MDKFGMMVPVYFAWEDLNFRLRARLVDLGFHGVEEWNSYPASGFSRKLEYVTGYLSRAYLLDDAVGITVPLTGELEKWTLKDNPTIFGVLNRMKANEELTIEKILQDPASCEQPEFPPAVIAGQSDVTVGSGTSRDRASATGL